MPEHIDEVIVDPKPHIIKLCKICTLATMFQQATGTYVPLPPAAANSNANLGINSALAPLSASSRSPTTPRPQPRTKLFEKMSASHEGTAAASCETPLEPANKTRGRSVEARPRCVGSWKSCCVRTDSRRFRIR